MKATVYSSRQAARISGVSLRQLAYWRKSSLLVPSHRTPGGHSRYTFSDLIALKSARQLLDAGVSLQKIRRSIDALLRFLPTLRRPLAEISLVATGDVILVLHEGSAFEALSGQQWVFPVARMEREIQQ
ncbi:MAG: MerR family transcriptional regulator, partial [Gammaproteobacteria bacterium]